MNLVMSKNIINEAKALLTRTVACLHETHKRSGRQDYLDAVRIIQKNLQPESVALTEYNKEGCDGANFTPD